MTTCDIPISCLELDASTTLDGIEQAASALSGLEPAIVYLTHPASYVEGFPAAFAYAMFETDRRFRALTGLPAENGDDGSCGALFLFDPQGELQRRWDDGFSALPLTTSLGWSQDAWVEERYLDGSHPFDLNVDALLFSDEVELESDSETLSGFSVPAPGRAVLVSLSDACTVHAGISRTGDIDAYFADEQATLDSIMKQIEPYFYYDELRGRFALLVAAACGTGSPQFYALAECLNRTNGACARRVAKTAHAVLAHSGKDIFSLIEDARLAECAKTAFIWSSYISAAEGDGPAEGVDDYEALAKSLGVDSAVEAMLAGAPLWALEVPRRQD